MFIFVLYLNHLNHDMRFGCMLPHHDDRSEVQGSLIESLGRSEREGTSICCFLSLRDQRDDAELIYFAKRLDHTCLLFLDYFSSPINKCS